MRYTLILFPDGAEIAGAVPSMPGCRVRGRTRAEALEEAPAAIRQWLSADGMYGREPLRETPELIAEAVRRLLEEIDERRRLRPDAERAGYELELATVEVSHPLLA